MAGRGRGARWPGWDTVHWKHASEMGLGEPGVFAPRVNPDLKAGRQGRRERSPGETPTVWHAGPGVPWRSLATPVVSSSLDAFLSSKLGFYGTPRWTGGQSKMPEMGQREGKGKDGSLFRQDTHNGVFNLDLELS